MMVKETNFIHSGQIITTEKIIKTVLWEASLEVSPGAIMLLHTGLNTQEDYLRLFSVAAKLEYLGRLVYKGKEGIKKPDSKVYDYWIFETSSGVRDEISSMCDANFYIDMNSNVESLNVAIAASILLYELGR